MKTKIVAAVLTLLIIIAGVDLMVVRAGYAQGSVGKYPLRDGVYINLTEDFYRALREEGSRSSSTYNTDKRDDYLRQIAVSSKFMVETNLQIIKQQERIIRLLESIDKKRK